MRRLSNIVKVVAVAVGMLLMASCGLPVLVKLLSRGPDGWSQASELSCQRADGRTGVRATRGVYTPGERVGGTLRLQAAGGRARQRARTLADTCRHRWGFCSDSSRVIIPGESHGQRSLAGYCPRVAEGRTRLKRQSTHTHDASEDLYRDGHFWGVTASQGEAELLPRKHTWPPSRTVRGWGRPLST